MSVPTAVLAHIRPGRGRLRLAARLGVVTLPAVYLLAVLTTPTGRADERVASLSHAPVGAVQVVKADADGSLHILGWARDGDARAGRQVTAYGLVDGAIVSRARASAGREHGRPRFELRVPLTAGPHSVCVGLQNIGPGISTLLRCVDTSSHAQDGLRVITRYDPTRSATYNARYNTYSSAQLQTRLVTSHSSSATARRSHSPRGAVRILAPDAPADATSGSAPVHIAGWGVDPDFLDRRVVGSVSVDGVQSTMFVSRASDAAQRRAGAGRLGAFVLDVRVPTGSHRVCVALVNIGPGATRQLPCAMVAVAAPVVTPTIVRGSGSVDPADYPATGAGKVVITAALRQIGRPYVWATAGPSTFDCSGLVLFSFADAGVAVPRIAAQQAAAATPITAAQARPGDLVFYHDSTGHVFHVGIYLAPGLTVAAVDPAEGVTLQPITDTGATYGSFTHS